MNVRIKNPLREGKRPVTAAAAPNTISETKASTCSRMKNNRNIAANAKKPGISRMLCWMPISLPVKDKTSTAKLLVSMVHEAKDTCKVAVIAISNMTGLRHPVFDRSLDVLNFTVGAL